MWELKRCFPCVCYTQPIPRLSNSQPIPCACYGILETQNKHINTHVVLNYHTIMVPFHFASRNVNTFEPNINQLFVNYQKKERNICCSSFNYVSFFFHLQHFSFISQWKIFPANQPTIKMIECHTMPTATAPEHEFSYGRI